MSYVIVNPGGSGVSKIKLPPITYHLMAMTDNIQEMKMLKYQIILRAMDKLSMEGMVEGM